MTALFLAFLLLISLPVCASSEKETARLGMDSLFAQPHPGQQPGASSGSGPQGAGSPSGWNEEQSAEGFEYDLDVRSTELTLMIYLCGSDLEQKCGSATQDIVEMCTSGFSQDVMNIIVMAGGSPYWYLDRRMSGTTGIYRVFPEGIVVLENDGRALNMGHPDTLSGFLDYAVREYPAEHYALVLWDHGSGSLGGVCHDMNFGGKALSMFELQSAMENSPFRDQKLDLIGFDACLMSAADTAMILAPYASYMIASQESEPAEGWDYGFLGGISSGADPAETGTAIAVSYMTSYGNRAGQQGSSVQNLTMSCIDLSGMEDMSSALNDYFGSIEISKKDFAAISRARRELYGFGSDAQFDLVDLGSVIDCLSPITGDSETEKASLALADCVSCSLPNDRKFQGLSVYFPFFNLAYAPAWMDYYEGLCFSDGYLSFIRQFLTLLTAGQDQAWGLTAPDVSYDKDNRTIIHLALSGEQIEEFGEARLIALQKDPDGEGWRMVALQDAVLTDAGSLNGQYVHTSLFVTDPDGSVIAEVPLLYTENSDGTLTVPVTLEDQNGETVPARLIGMPDENSDTVFVESVFLYDEAIGGYSSRLSLTREELAEQYASVTCLSDYRIPSRYGGEGTGALLPFDLWASAAEVPYTWDAGCQWELAFVRDHLDPASVALAFQITDIFNNVYLSTPVTLTGEAIDDTDPLPVYLLDYDDSSVLLLEENGFVLTQDGTLLMSLTSLADEPVRVCIDHAAVNGSPVEFREEIRGSGSDGMLMPGEKSSVFLQIPAEGPVRELDFDFVLSDPDGAETGCVAVHIHS